MKLEGRAAVGRCRVGVLGDGTTSGLSFECGGGGGGGGARAKCSPEICALTHGSHHVRHALQVGRFHHLHCRPATIKRQLERAVEHDALSSQYCSIPQQFTESYQSLGDDNPPVAQASCPGLEPVL